MIADKRTYLAPLAASLRKGWPEYRPHYIVCHGHSVVTGACAGTLVRPFDAYPHLWHRLLNEKYPTALISMIVTAIGGENSAQGEKRFAEEVLCHRPDLVTLDYGLNDRAIGLKAAKDAWRSMLDRCMTAEIPVILLTPTLDVKSVTDPAEGEILAAHAEQIRALADEYGTGLCDPYARFMQYLAQGAAVDELLCWPNHPGRLGHEMIARELSGWFPMDIT